MQGPFAALDDSQSESEGLWFVYLFALYDCSTFKIGFSCNPLRRLCSFSPRFHERFDLQESRLLRVDSCESARRIESILKAEFSSANAVCPSWLPKAAGGHTEWFSAVYLGEATTRLVSFASDNAGSIASAAETLRQDLLERRRDFETWAVSVAQQLNVTPGALDCARQEAGLARTLRDWLDIHRALNVPIFQEQIDEGAFVREIHDVYSRLQY